jgi:hypothetical protein
MGSRSRKAAFIAAFLIAVLAVSVYAYLASLPSPPGPRVTITSPPLQFSMQLDKTEYRLGENVTIKFWLKNTSNMTITLHCSSIFPYEGGHGTPMLFDFIITRANGTEIYRWSEWHGAAEVVYDFTLDPGQEINQTNTWFQTSGDLLYPKEVQVPAGTYYIRGVIPPGRVGFGVSGVGRIALETPSVAFVIS